MKKTGGKKDADSVSLTENDGCIELAQKRSRLKNKLTIMIAKLKASFARSGQPVESDSGINSKNRPQGNLFPPPPPDPNKRTPF